MAGGLKLEDNAIRGGSGEGNAVTSALSGLGEHPRRLRTYLHDVRVEMRQVNWPSRLDVSSTTIVVTVTVAFFGIYFWLTDLVFSRLYVLVNGYFKKF
jgi:preprotein translocase subunit SecE